jgi:hypothetical protein
MIKQIQSKRFYITSDGGRIGNFWWSNADYELLKLQNPDGTFRQYRKLGTSYWGTAPNVFFFDPEWIYWKIKDRVTWIFRCLGKA